MDLRFGYGTNGFANHRLDDALAVLADLGYSGIALTLDHAHLDPFAEDLPRRVDAVRARLAGLGLSVVIETGARYLLDPRRRHHPSLVSEEGREVRVDLLRRAVWIAADLGAECVSFWSGMPPAGTDPEAGWRWLIEGVEAVLVEADRRGVPLGLEPEPGMLVGGLDDALMLRARLGDPELLKITLDAGHCVAIESRSVAECIHIAGSLLVNVHLDDTPTGVHEHLEFGEGDLDLPATLGALQEIGYSGLACVDLPRHSHAAPAVALHSIAALHSASWVASAQRRIRTDAAAISMLFPAAGRHCGRGPVDPVGDPDGVVKGTEDDNARVALLAALAEALPADSLATEVALLYRYGDAAEKRGVLRGLSTLDSVLPVEVGLDLVRDALRTDDTGLVAAAMGPFAVRHLDVPSWRQGVLKCLSVGVPLTPDATSRMDDELGRMVSDFVAERRAAGQAVPHEATNLLTYLHFAQGAPA